MALTKGAIFVTRGGFIKCVESIQNGDVKFDDRSIVDLSSLDDHRLLFEGYGTMDSEWDLKQCCEFLSSAAVFVAKLLEEANHIFFEIDALMKNCHFESPEFQSKIVPLLGRLDSLLAMARGVISEAVLKLKKINEICELHQTPGNVLLSVVAVESIGAIEVIVKSLGKIVDLVSGFEPDTSSILTPS